MSVWVLNRASHPSLPMKPGHHGKGHLCFIVQQRPLREPSLSVPGGPGASPCPHPNAQALPSPLPSAGWVRWGNRNSCQ